MVKTNDKIAEKNIEGKLSKGYIQFNAILEIVGKPKDHVEKTFADYLAQIKKSVKYEVISEKVEEVIPVEGSDNLFSTFAEIGVLATNMGALFDFCFECMPASIEIIAPQHLTLRGNEASGAVNDLIGRIHHLDMQSKQINQQNALLNQNLRLALENAVIIFLSQKPHAINEISAAVGMSIDQLPALLEQMVSAGRIVVIEGDIYGIAGVPVTRKSANSGGALSGKNGTSDSAEDVIKLKKTKEK